MIPRHIFIGQEDTKIASLKNYDIEILRPKATTSNFCGILTLISPWYKSYIDWYLKKTVRWREWGTWFQKVKTINGECIWVLNLLFFCGKRSQEKNPKYPDCWQKYAIVQTVYKAVWIDFNSFILKICSLPNYELSRNVRFRVNSAISDLHVADTRFHRHGKIWLLYSTYVKLLASETSETLEVNIVLESVKEGVPESHKEMWNSVDLYSMYSEGGDCKYSRRTLIKFDDYCFGDEVVFLPSPGLASIPVFKKYCHLLYDAQMTVMTNICYSSNQSRDVGHDRNQYKVQFDVDTVNKDFSSTMMDLLGEFNIGNNK